MARVLARIYDGVSVDQHDDGSEDSQHDLDVSGPLRGAVEVGLVTDADIRRAKAHWQRALAAHKTADLKWSWTFMFSDLSGLGRPVRYPRVDRPDTTDLTTALARLEARGIMRVGRKWDHVVFEPGGWRLGDPDIAELFRLLGPAAENASAIDLSHHGELGGWSFAFGFGLCSSGDPDRFATEVEALLHDAARSDMREKLRRSRQPVRIGALVFDSTTAAGWSTGHLSPSTTPQARIHLPSEITHVLIAGMNDLTLMFSASNGWTRHDAATHRVVPSEA